jgi:glutamate N-acetyltransferase/amino-acid N-acetyltransferase
MYGEDANWGRIMAAMGGSRAYFNPDKVHMTFSSEKGKIVLMRNGEPEEFDENLAADILSERDIFVRIRLSDGNEKARAWGCDLGHEYIRINGEYRSRG